VRALRERERFWEGMEEAGVDVVRVAKGRARAEDVELAAGLEGALLEGLVCALCAAAVKGEPIACERGCEASHQDGDGGWRLSRADARVGSCGGHGVG
jgi:hypothetical protein